MKIKYKIYNPSGNITALVIGDEYNIQEKRLINNAIMKENLEVEQVGFVSTRYKKLTMAGGEFCGNATRCAAKYYSDESITTQIEINSKKIAVGIDKNDNVWCEIPINGYENIKLSENIYKIKLEGITIIVINDKKYINKNLKEKAKDIIEFYNITDKAVGVMFSEKKNNILKIYPVVWVKAINTVFLENACGSGSIGVTMTDALLKRKSGKYSVYQPSKEFLETEIKIKNNKVFKAILKGKILSDNKILEIEI